MKRSPSVMSSIAVATLLAVAVPAPAAAQHRRGGGGRTSGGDGGDRAVPRGDSGGGSAPAPQPAGGGRASAAPQRGAESEQHGGERARPSSRQRGGQLPEDTAIARRRVPPSGGGPVFIDRGYYRDYYPWGYGGYGFGGYYGGLYDPWFYGSYGGYGGYGSYGGYGGYPGYYGSGYEGSLRIKVRPRDASVFVDGYYAGVVDEFDGIFQRLRVEPGPHRIEVRADGYEPLSLEIRVQPGRTVNYTGELRRLP